MEFLNIIRENGIFDYALVTIISRCSLFPTDFIFSILIIIIENLYKTDFKKIDDLLKKELVLIVIQILNYFNIININGKCYVVYLFLVFIYVGKLLKKMKLGTKLVITYFITNEIASNGTYFTKNFSTGNAIEFFMIQSLFFINTISLIGKANNNLFDYLIILLGFLPVYIIKQNFEYLLHHFIKCFYLFSGKKEIYFFIYWSILLFCFSFINNSFQKLNIRKTVKRKIYHFLAFIILVPAIKYMEKEILKLILMIVSYLFIVFEFVRNSEFLKDFSFIKEINLFMNDNIDYRDDNNFIVTHIFLMTGLISSLYYDNRDNYAFNYLGIIVLGIGDAMTAICGVYLGKTRIYALNIRTLEGTLGGLISSSFLYYIFNGSINKFELINFVIIFLYEGYTLEIDNLFLPLLSNNLFMNSDLIKQNIIAIFK